MIDIHVHFFPESVFRAIWKFFENGSKGLWKIKYKLHGEKIRDYLKSEGASRFTTLVYAHKPGMADFLNDYIYQSGQMIPELIPFGTIFAGDGEVKKTALRIFEDFHFFGIKLHPFVSNEELDDPRLFAAYEIMEGLGKVLVCHPGSGPVYQKLDGAKRLRTVLRQFPKLKVVVAHCGAFEYGNYLSLSDEFESVYYDTAMNCVHTEVFHDNCPGREFFLKYANRILFGSDFPNIPYSYTEQVDAIRHFHFEKTLENDIFFGNAKRLLGIEN
ncbi:MAG: amidohydrolase family protein [Leptospira sp.]|nr:amidohydrolase family protein [Leptospira sp.]